MNETSVDCCDELYGVCARTADNFCGRNALSFVKKALKNVEGVEAVKVTLETKQAVVTAKEGISDAVYLDAVKTTGYEGVIRSRKAH